MKDKKLMFLFIMLGVIILSAIFAPLTNIGMIIMDEEHSDTYKQDKPARQTTGTFPRTRP